MEKIKMPFRDKYPITQEYGVKVNYMRAGIHNGIDWGLPKGTPLLACFTGKVIKAEKWQFKGYGREIQIQREDGLIAQYAHCSQIFVKVGIKIEAGTIIGESGNTGFVLGKNGYHLHFGVKWKNEWIDPKKVINIFNQIEKIKIEVENKNENKIHTVVQGDTLTKIAKLYLGNENLWKKIYEINKSTIDNPNQIKIGQKIEIPNS
jgi:murein DD-endopeptidase MepM/ murein hydrolase activator NlpD